MYIGSWSLKDSKTIFRESEFKILLTYQNENSSSNFENTYINNTNDITNSLLKFTSD